MMKPFFPLLIAALTLSCGGQPSQPAGTTVSAPASTAASAGADALPSWNDGASKRAIVDFVGRVTRQEGPEFVQPSERIAVFDNDGTLWAEKPVPFQLLFAFDRVKAMAPQHPEWSTRQPFASLLKGDMAGVLAAGEKGVLEIVSATHTGMTTDEFSQAVQDWIASARHPQTKRLYTEMVYVHHDDAAREFAYDRNDKLQKFSVGWDEALTRKWTVVSMRDDWRTIFPPAKN